MFPVIVMQDYDLVRLYKPLPVVAKEDAGRCGPAGTASYVLPTLFLLVVSLQDNVFMMAFHDAHTGDGQ
jgi:hypothetical protein